MVKVVSTLPFRTDGSCVSAEDKNHEYTGVIRSTPTVTRNQRCCDCVVVREGCDRDKPSGIFVRGIPSPLHEARDRCSPVFPRRFRPSALPDNRDDRCPGTIPRHFHAYREVRSHWAFFAQRPCFHNRVDRANRCCRNTTCSPCGFRPSSRQHNP